MWEQIEKFRNFSGILNFLFYEGKFFGLAEEGIQERKRNLRRKEAF